MANEWLRLIVAFLLMLLMIITICLLLEMNERKYDIACQKIGYVDYIHSSGISCCEDANGNLHYVKTYKVNYEIRVKEISVGDVRVIEHAR